MGKDGLSSNRHIHTSVPAHRLRAQQHTMASKSICSRCLRLASSHSTNRPLPAFNPSHRSFSTTVAKQPSRTRRIHQSSKQQAVDVEPPQRSANEIPPFNTPRGRTEDLHPEAQVQNRVLLQRNNLFHSFTNSPAPQIRKRAAFIRQNAYCPHPDHQPTRAPVSPVDAEGRKLGAVPPSHVRYECPDCGIPVSCSLEHLASDYEAHLQLCDTLKEINEDDHDLVSGRLFPEFEMPGPQLEEAQVNMTNWDTMLYSREFNAVNDERSMRQVTRLLTYPVTVGSLLHELSPYNLNERLTPEGLRSLSGKHATPRLPLPHSKH